MTKELLEDYISKCKAAGIEKIAIRYEDGSRSIVIGNEGCRVELLDDVAIFVEPTHNYATPNGQFNITSCPYEYIDNIRALDATIPQTIALLTALNIYDEDADAMIKGCVKRQTIIPGTAGLTTIKDADGNDVIPPGSSGYVTM